MRMLSYHNRITAFIVILISVQAESLLYGSESPAYSNGYSVGMVTPNDSDSGCVSGEVLVRLERRKQTNTRILFSYGSATDCRDKALFKSLGKRYELNLQSAEDSVELTRLIRLSGRSYGLYRTEGNIRRVCDNLMRDAEVEYAQPNYRYEPMAIPNDPYFPDQYAHQLTQTSLAWDIETGREDVLVAVIGTGVDIDHPDLKPNIWKNPDEIDGNMLDDDQNGYVDDCHGWDFGDMDADVRPAGHFYFRDHETNVAGVIAAVGGNEIGVCGVTWRCKIMPLRLSDDFTSSEIAQAIIYAMKNGAQIINMSFGNSRIRPQDDLLVREAIDSAFDRGVLLVASAGNGNTGQLNLQYPAGYYNVLAVSATNEADLRSNSTFGLWVDIAAPGSNIVTTGIGGSYVGVSGTSISSPYISGVAALLLSHQPTLTNIEVRALLENTVDPIQYGSLDPNSAYLGTGRVNAYEAVQNSHTAYPVAEIIAPCDCETFAGDTDEFAVEMFVQGDQYQLAYRLFDSADWHIVEERNLSNTSGHLFQVSLRNPGEGTYFLRLTAMQDGRKHNDQKLFRIAYESDQDGWPSPALGEQYPERPKCSAICMDIDGDGDNEVIQSSSFQYTLDAWMDILESHTYIWNADGSSLSGWPQTLDDVASYGSSAVGDVDGDGDYEVVTITDWQGGVHVWHWQDGAMVKGSWPVVLNEVGFYWNKSIPNLVLADLDTDGDSEILVSISPQYDLQNTTGLYAIQGDGTLIWRQDYEVLGTLSAADLNGNGHIEIVFCGYGPDDPDLCTYVLNDDGKRLQRWIGGSSKGTAITDLDSDGKLDIVACRKDCIRALHLDGNVFWQSPLEEGFDKSGAISIGDFNNDGLKEVIVNSKMVDEAHTYSLVYAWNFHGQLLTEIGFPKSVVGYAVNSAPIIGDVNGDGLKDLLIGCAGTSLMAWDQLGEGVPGYPLLNFNSENYTTPTLVDLDLDGDIELMTGTSKRTLDVVDLPGHYSPELSDWSMFRHDPQCSGQALRVAKINDPVLPEVVTPGETLELKLSASNPSNLPIRFYVRQMPEGAFFDEEKNTLIWTPGPDKAGQIVTFILFLTDGVRQDMRPVSVKIGSAK